MDDPDRPGSTRDRELARSDAPAAEIPAGGCDPSVDLLCVGNDDAARALAAAGFRALWGGRAARPSELVPAAPDDGDAVAAVLAERGRTELDGDGRLVGIHGLTLRVTRHRIVCDGCVHWTWCAFDAIGIPAALGLDATTHTDCPACGSTITVGINGGVPADHTAVLWLPDLAGTNLMSDFCARADLYCSLEHLEQRLDIGSAPGRSIDVRAAAELGRATWADVAHLAGTTPMTPDTPATSPRTRRDRYQS